ncbi:histone-like nucleoid-structuring protein Lsr2 [Streptomyces sp. RLB3-6]|uniref:Lsr2 family DNA-binding protein n=1 Tax=Streptomyces sp. RLB3-6 TaxID=2594457 RepID=UPI0013DF5FD5|nr:histone-like nucleoid-structuring protein Lsr2 [Streptomyces sp. RLB3-6]
MSAHPAVILSMNSDGYSDQQIADHLEIDRSEVTRIIDADRAAQTDQLQDGAERAGQPEPVPEPPAEAIPELAALLAWAAAHDEQTVRADGEQAAAVLAALRGRRAVDAELEQITTEKSQLEERLAALQARESTLRPEPAGGKRKQQDRDYEPSEVRAWARQNGYTVPDRARIPKKVLDAWRQRDGAPRLASVG